MRGTHLFSNLRFVPLRAWACTLAVACTKKPTLSRALQVVRADLRIHLYHSGRSTQRSSSAVTMASDRETLPTLYEFPRLVIIYSNTNHSVKPSHYVLS